MSIHTFAAALVTATVIAVPAPAFAQHFGIKAGASLAKLTPEEEDEPEPVYRLGPAGGIWFSLPLGQRLSFQAEGLFVEKGAKYEITAAGPGTSGEIRLRYLELPLLARLGFGSSTAPASVYFVAGAAPAFKLSARATATIDGVEHSRDADEDVYRFDLGLVGGAGVAFGRAGIEARYTHGITHINTDDNGDDDRIRNRAFTLLVNLTLR